MIAIKTRKMEKTTFTKLVLDELEAIKTKATKEEIDRLDFTTLDVKNNFKCIYGQMTGDCFSKRAKELMPKSFDYLFGTLGDKDYRFQNQSFEKGESFTALEKYLGMCDSVMHKKIIQYLKGEIQEIKLTYTTK